MSGVKFVSGGIYFFLLFLCTSLPIFSGERVGNRDYLQDYKYWRPSKSCVSFAYNNAGVIQGFEVRFMLDNTTLYQDWKIKDGHGDLHPYPFILESTLIVHDMGEVGLRSDQRGTGWDVSNDQMCLADSAVYLDSQFLDIEADNFGIGILYPHTLIKNAWYRYNIALLPYLFGKDPHTLKATLRFRLNVDIWQAAAYGYKPWDDSLKIGDITGAKTAYYTLYPTFPNPNSRTIGNVFSFALADYSSDVIQNIFMSGEDCKP